MSSKIKKVYKIVLGIILIPFIFSIYSFITELLMQLGRIFGTIIRMVMEL